MHTCKRVCSKNTLQNKGEDHVDRIEKLESQIRRLRAVVVLLGVVLCAGVLLAWTKPDGDFNTVKARELVIQNAAGNQVAGLYADGGGRLYLRNETLQVVTSLP